MDSDVVRPLGPLKGMGWKGGDEECQSRPRGRGLLFERNLEMAAICNHVLCGT